MNTLRQTLRKQRKTLSKQQRTHHALRLSLHLPKLLPLLPKNANIGLYLDDFGEMPTLPLLRFCQKHGFIPHLPITKQGKPLQFAPITLPLSKTPTKRHAFGMKEPLTRHTLPATALDCIICPLVAVDKKGNRLGMGGGFYDRTFAIAPKVLKVGICYDFQIVEHLPTQVWDKGVDMVMSNKGVLWF